MLGKDILQIFYQTGKFELFGLNRKYDDSLDYAHSVICDITDEKELNKCLKEINPNIIINCAAKVNVDECEKDKQLTYKLHVKATKQLASYKSNDTRFVYISTDSVFNGLRGNYKELSKTNPLNYYAFTKLQGEKEALKCNKNTIVIRTNIYGFHKEEGSSLVEWALKCFKNSDDVNGFKDVNFNPVYTKQLARVVLELINIKYVGLLNVGCNEYISKYDFLIKLSKEFQIDTKLINKISVEDILFGAKRLKNTTLNLDKFKSILNYDLGLEEGLKEMHIDLLNKRGEMGI